MVMSGKVAAIATAAVLAITPATAVAATKAHPSPKATCAALLKKDGTKKFDAKYGVGKKHSGAMAHCVKLHTKKTSSSTS
jgi:hypothetical protein